MFLKSFFLKLLVFFKVIKSIWTLLSVVFCSSFFYLANKQSHCSSLYKFWYFRLSMTVSLILHFIFYFLVYVFYVLIDSIWNKASLLYHFRGLIVFGIKLSCYSILGGWCYATLSGTNNIVLKLFYILDT